MISAWSAKRIGLFATVAVLAISAPAMADFSGFLFEITASGSTGQDTFAVGIDEGEWDGDSYTWTLAESYEFWAGGELLGVLSAEQGATAVAYQTDPVVNLSFSVTAGPNAGGTDFTIKSALLSFPTILAADAKGRASTSFTVTDGLDDDGATLTPLAAPKAYLAQYNGFVPDGTTFTNLIDAIVVAPEDTIGVSAEYPGGGAYELIGVDVNDMSAQISFTLSPNDLASGTSTFEIIPEPATFILLAGLALLRRR
jgi:hypothetical protein